MRQVVGGGILRDFGILFQAECRCLFWPYEWSGGLLGLKYFVTGEASGAVRHRSGKTSFVLLSG